MREILFRGKPIYGGKMVEGYLEYYRQSYNGELVCYIAVWGKKMDQVIPETIGQYTGLKDKNGKRIFEGDILKDDWGKVYEVFFTEQSCSFMARLENAPNEYEKGNYRIGRAWCDTIRVIGNIHDTPELLKDGNGSEKPNGYKKRILRTFLGEYT